MHLAYFKRLRMDINLTGRDLTPTPVPEHYYFLPWEESLLDAFARAKYLGFRGEIDTEVFPCLAEFDGCRKLMREIVRKPGFVPESTWLVVHTAGDRAQPEYCGTVQGVRDCHGFGAIQNIGVARQYRRCGLGASLLLRSLSGFRAAGVQRVYLEVTIQNDAAIRLYRRVGFAPVRTVYKTVEAAYSP
jgi:ribosomal protein S18 acetylase RimI-like enzyme